MRSSARTAVIVTRTGHRQISSQSGPLSRPARRWIRPGRRPYRFTYRRMSTPRMIPSEMKLIIVNEPP
jgi:hypothetical protein